MLEYSKDNDVALFTIDDGKANAVGYAFIEAVNAALDRATSDAKAVVMTGRAGVFSGGFDLKEISKGPDAAVELVTAGARLLLRVLSHPQPVVAACSGHAIAAGAFLLLGADTRIGAEGNFRIGLNETAIGMALPVFGLTLARERLSKRHLTSAVVQAKLYDPEGAKDAGFLDEVVAPGALLDTTMAAAKTLASLPSEAYAANKLATRQAAIDTIAASLNVP